MEDEFNAAVAAELRAQRGRVQKTIDALVSETGLSKSAVLNYLNNKRDIPVPALYALCRALGASPRDIMDLAEKMIAPSSEQRSPGPERGSERSTTAPTIRRKVRADAPY